VAAASTSTLTKNLDSNFSTFNKYSPGVAVTVLQNGNVLAKKAYGLAGFEFKVPFTHHTDFRMTYSEGRVISLARGDTNHTTKNVL
jgi:CubicO group peptidase (beta-lactamase class C family)